MCAPNDANALPLTHSHTCEPARLAPEKMRQALVLELGRALHSFGTPTHRLEAVLESASHRLGLQAQILSTPTSIMLAFGPMDTQQIALLRVEPGGVQLDKLSELDELIEELFDERVDAQDALARVRALVHAPQRFGEWWIVASGAGASGAIARFFGGSPLEIAIGALLGALVGALMVHASSRRATAHLLDPVAAAAVAVVAAALACVFPLNVHMLIIAALIMLVPGFTLTLAIQELATRHLVAGASRMFGATLVFLELGFGVFLAHKLGQVFPVLENDALPRAVGGWFGEGVAMAVSAAAFGIFFQARPRDFGWIALSVGISYLTARGATELTGPELGAFLGALAVGLSANLFARRTRRPASIMLVPGTIMLVPGSVGLRSMTALIGQDVVGGVEGAFAALMIAISIVAGLLVADAAAPARRAL